MRRAVAPYHRLFLVQSVHKTSCTTHFHMSSLSSLFRGQKCCEKNIVISHRQTWKSNARGTDLSRLVHSLTLCGKARRDRVGVHTRHLISDLWPHRIHSCTYDCTTLGSTPDQTVKHSSYLSSCRPARASHGIITALPLMSSFLLSYHLLPAARARESLGSSPHFLSCRRSLSLLVVWSFDIAVSFASDVSQHDHPNAHALAQVSTKQCHRMFTTCMVAGRRL